MKIKYKCLSVSFYDSDDIFREEYYELGKHDLEVIEFDHGKHKLRLKSCFSEDYYDYSLCEYSIEGEEL